MVTRYRAWRLVSLRQEASRARAQRRPPDRATDDGRTQVPRGPGTCRRDHRGNEGGRRVGLRPSASGAIVILWRAGLRISEALALAETDLEATRGSLVVRRGKGGKRRRSGWMTGAGNSWLAGVSRDAAGRSASVRRVGRRLQPRRRTGSNGGQGRDGADLGVRRRLRSRGGVAGVGATARREAERGRARVIPPGVSSSARASALSPPPAGGFPAHPERTSRNLERTTCGCAVFGTALPCARSRRGGVTAFSPGLLRCRRIDESIGKQASERGPVIATAGAKSRTVRHG